MPHRAPFIYIYSCCVDGYLVKQTRSVSERKWLGAMPGPNGIKSTRRLRRSIAEGRRDGGVP